MDNREKEQFVNEYLDSDNAKRIRMVLEQCKDDCLYRYRPFHADCEKQALERKQLWMSSYAHLEEKDPLEGSIESSNAILISGLKEYRKNYAVTCFTELYDNEFFWKEYADNGNGICITYSIEEMCSKGYFIIPVVYKERKTILDIVCKRREKIYVTKGDEYQKEAEWRHIEEISPQKAGAYSEISPAIKEILLGKNLSPADCAWLEEFCHKNKILLKSNDKM